MHFKLRQQRNTSTHAQQPSIQKQKVGGDLISPEVVTAPYDPRFPSTNQARHCFVRYNEYYKCVFERGAEVERCAFYKRAYESLCPEEWVEEWEELREQGLWMGKY
jgi:cytochrome c oxidase subunit 6b